MIKVKTSELTGAALDWAVGVAEEYELNLYGVDPSIRARVPGLGVHAPWSPHKYWNQGGPIIEREGICLAKVGRSIDDAIAPHPECWCAHIDGTFAVYGPEPLVAAMRCYVASKMGYEIEIPEELK